ncbi:MAG: IPT/TIG domain-containing protein [Verrucomicrobiales bacterium]|nr:IPT/TIG domain-containing protein [Verrucomicrobiales bacterium]
MSPGPLPAITSISTSEAAFGSTITVDGRNFGSSQDALTVGGSSDGVDIQSWSDTRIIFVLLDPASSGRVTVTTDHSTSHEGIDLRVTISDPAPADVTYTVWSSTTPDLATGTPIATKHGTAPWGGSATVTSTPSTGSTTITTIDDPSPPASNGFLWLTVSPR